MRTVRRLVCSFRLIRVHDVSVLSRNCALDTVPQAASPQPRTPTRKARPGLHLEVSSATRAPRAFKKRGAFGSDDDGDAESDRIKTLTESFVGSRGWIHNLTMLYVQEDINESFADSEHAAVALMWSGSGVGKIAKDYTRSRKRSRCSAMHLKVCARKRSYDVFDSYYMC